MKLLGIPRKSYMLLSPTGSQAIVLYCDVVVSFEKIKLLPKNISKSMNCDICIFQIA